MDNASFRKSEEMKKIIEAEGHQLIYLPPYSSDLNPIEGKWTHLKSLIKTMKDKFVDFYDCLDYCLNTMS
jgi:transposase